MLKRIGIAVVGIALLMTYTNSKMNRLEFVIEHDVPLQAIVDTYDSEVEQARSESNDTSTIELTELNVEDQTNELEIVVESKSVDTEENLIANYGVTHDSTTNVPFNHNTSESKAVDQQQNQPNTNQLVGTEVNENVNFDNSLTEEELSTDPISDKDLHIAIEPTSEINLAEENLKIENEPNNALSKSESEENDISSQDKKKKDANNSSVAKRTNSNESELIVVNSYNEICNNYNSQIQGLENSANSAIRAVAKQALEEYSTLTTDEKKSYTKRSELVNKYFLMGTQLETKIDSQMKTLLIEYEEKLTSSGFSTSVIESVKNTYENKKNEMQAILFTQMMENLE